MLTIYFGHDERAEAGTTAFVRSVIAHASEPISLVPITRKATPGHKEGSNAFTFRRFLVPYLQGWRGWALYVDGSDMLFRSDPCELFALSDPYMAVQVVQHEYLTKHPRKYVGTAMETDNTDYPRRNWASVMLINCSNFAWRALTPEYVATATPMHLLQLCFLRDDRIGALPKEWNWLAQEDGENEDAKLIHYTNGIPAFEAYTDSPMADEWHAALASATRATG